MMKIKKWKFFITTNNYLNLLSVVVGKLDRYQSMDSTIMDMKSWRDSIRTYERITHSSPTRTAGRRWEGYWITGRLLIWSQPRNIHLITIRWLVGWVDESIWKWKSSKLFVCSIRRHSYMIMKWINRSLYCPIEVWVVHRRNLVH